MQNMNLLNYILRFIIVFIKPLLIYTIGTSVSEVYASEIAKFYLYTTIFTAILSGSIYREYIEGFFNNDMVRVNLSKQKLRLHIYIVSVLLLTVALVSDTKMIITAMIIDFALHQIYRVALYRKKIVLWFLLNFLSILSVTTIAMVSNLGVENIINKSLQSLGIVIILLLFLFLLAKNKKDINCFVSYFLSIKSLYGIQRKVFVNFDKILLSLILSDSTFWIIAIIFQIFSGATTAYESIKIFPLKKEFALQNIKYHQHSGVHLNIFLVWLSFLMAVIFCYTKVLLEYKMLYFLMLISFRTYVYNFLNMKMEIVFWSENFSAMIASLTLMNFFGIVASIFVYINVWQDSDLIVITISIILFCILNFMLGKKL